MKLFKSLLVAPATLGLLEPLSATANEVTVNDFSPVEEMSNIGPLLAGGEGLVEDHSHDGGFSESTTASFSVDTTIGSIDGDTVTEATTFEYQYNIGLSPTITVVPPNGNVYVRPSSTNASPVESKFKPSAPAIADEALPMSIVALNESSPVKLVSKPIPI